MSDANSLDRLNARLTAGRTRLVAHVAAAGMLRFVAVGALAVLALALAGVALAGVAEAPLVLAALAVGALATAFGLCVARPLALAPGLKAYALLAEERFPEARSLLVNALELAPAASGPGDLRHAVVVEAARRADGLSLAALAPTALPRNTARLLGLAVALWALGLGFFGGPLGGAVDRLLHPGAAAATLVKIAVEPGDVTLPPGATLHVRATVTGTTQRPTLHFARPGGEDRVGMERAPEDAAPATAAPGMPPARGFDGAVRNVATSGTYWVEALGVRSPLYTVTLKGEPGIVSFDLTYEYPAYTRLSAETRASTTGDVSALTGTQVTVVVNLDRDAKDVSWRLPGQGLAALAPLSPRRWRGQMTVGAAGPYTVAVATDKAHIEQAYRIAPVADQPPLLTVIQPEGDLDLPAGQKIALWATGTDDYGLTRLSLVAQNEAGKVLRTTLAQWPDQPRDASVGVDWDAADLALLPGQSATFHLELADNDAVRGPNVTVSRTFTLRFPLLSEIYKSLESDHDSTRADLEQAQRETKELQKQVDDLQKGLQNDRQVSWEKQQAAKSAAAKQQELADRVAKAAQSLDQQAEKAQEHKAYDEQLLSKMQELSKLVSQIKSEDLKRAMGELSKKVDQVDPRQLQSELKDLEQQQKEMLQNLDRTLALMEKLRDEEKTHEAAARAQEMAQQQKRLNDELANKPPTDAPKADALAQKQDELQAKAKELSDDLKKLAQEMEQRDAKSDEAKPDAPKADDGAPKPSQPMKQGAQALDQDITPSMEKSASDMRQSPQSDDAKSGAKQSGKQAQQGLENLSQSLSKAANDMSNDQDQAVAEAIKRSAQDLLNLSQAGEQAMNAPGPSQQKAEAAQDLSQGANLVVQDLLGTGKDTPYLGPEASQQLGRAINQLERAKDAYANGDESQGKSAGQSAGEAIDKAVISLRNSASACKTPGPKNGGKNGGGSKPKMQGLADQQSDLNSDTQSLAERLTKQQRIAAGDQASLEKLAARQQMIRQGIEEAMNDAKPGEQPLGRMDQAKDDADQVAQDLKRGRLDDDTLTRQQKILSRMLDATRSIHRRDYEEQRESNHGVDMPRPSPTDLRADLLKRADRVQGDLLRAQAEKYPGEYRSLVESYLRRLGATE